MNRSQKDREHAFRKQTEYPFHTNFTNNMSQSRSQSNYYYKYKCIAYNKS